MYNGFTQLSKTCWLTKLKLLKVVVLPTSWFTVKRYSCEGKILVFKRNQNPLKPSIAGSVTYIFLNIFNYNPRSKAFGLDFSAWCAHFWMSRGTLHLDVIKVEIILTICFYSSHYSPRLVCLQPSSKEGLDRSVLRMTGIRTVILRCLVCLLSE